jgi:hypothetical protein
MARSDLIYARSERRNAAEKLAGGGVIAGG